MFKNCVFKVSVDTKKWIKSTLVRCVRTFSASVVAGLPTTAAALGSINWTLVFSMAATSVVIIFFTCLAGLPEVESEAN